MEPPPMRTLLTACFVCSLLLLAFDSHAESPEVSVRVRATREGENTKYTYSVRNNGLEPVVRLVIGMDCDGDRLGEFHKRPLGYYDHRCPRNSLGTPPGWKGDCEVMEEEWSAQVNWVLKDSTTTGGVLPGGELSGFSILVPGRGAAAYTKGHFYAVHPRGEGICGRVTTDPAK